MTAISLVHMHECYSNSAGTRAPGSANITTNTDDGDNDDDDDEGGLSTVAIVFIAFGAYMFCLACVWLTFSFCSPFQRC